MTVENMTVKNVYEGNGNATVFPYTFSLAPEDGEYVGVYVADETRTSRRVTNFIVNTTAKTVKYPTSGEPLSPGNWIVLRREIPTQQTLNLENQGAFFAEDIERQFDRTVMMIQQLRESLSRAVLTDMAANYTPQELLDEIHDSVQKTSLAAQSANADAISAGKSAESAANSAATAIENAAKTDMEKHNNDVAAHPPLRQLIENRVSALLATLGGYLPLTGGVITGAIIVGNCPGMKKATDREETYIYGGTTNQDGAAFSLRGINCTVYGEESRGSFGIAAKSKSGQSHYLVGLGDGRLLWDDKLLVYSEEVINWSNNHPNPSLNEWYNCVKWNDGRAEIYGYAVQQANQLGVTLNYPLPLLRHVTGGAYTVAAAGTGFCGITSFTYGTTSVGYFTVRNSDYSVPTTPVGICFTVRGYWK